MTTVDVLMQALRDILTEVNLAQKEIENGGERVMRKKNIKIPREKFDSILARFWDIKHVLDSTWNVLGDLEDEVKDLDNFVRSFDSESETVESLEDDAKIARLARQVERAWHSSEKFDEVLEKVNKVIENYIDTSHDPRIDKPKVTPDNAGD